MVISECSGALPAELARFLRHLATFSGPCSVIKWDWTLGQDGYIAESPKYKNNRCWSVNITPKPQNYAGNELLPVFFIPGKNVLFLQKSIFRNIFGDFYTPQAKEFCDFGDSAMCPS